MIFRIQYITELNFEYWCMRGDSDKVRSRTFIHCLAAENEYWCMRNNSDKVRSQTFIQCLAKLFYNALPFQI